MCLRLLHDLDSNLARLTFSDLANVQTVGMGMYLALAVIQVVSAGGVSTLRRRVTSLQQGVRSAKMVPEYVVVAGLQTEVSRLEISFDALNRSILRLVFWLFLISLAHFSYTTIFKEFYAYRSGSLFIFGYYLVLPVLIFVSSTRLISRRCRDTIEKVRAAERRFATAPSSTVR